MAHRFNLESRIKLETLLRMPSSNGFVSLSITARIKIIAEIIGVTESTIYREVVKRGFSYDNYNAKRAHADSVRKVSIANTHFKYTEEQKKLLLELFKGYATNKDWSPNALLLRLKSELPHDIKLPTLETLYRWIYEDAASGGDLYKLLPRKHKKRKLQKKSVVEKVINKKSIHQRDAVVDNRSRLGDVEVDSIVSAGNKAGLVTATERKSRLLMACKVPSKDSIAARDALCIMLKGRKVKTITSDNGSEFAMHEQISKALGALYYFADPYSSYQRGSNENGNGMIRRYYPKGIDFTSVADTELQQNIYLINHLPRKIHGGKTAHEVYYGINKRLIKAKHRTQFIFAFRT